MVTLLEATQAAQIEHYFQYSGQERVCTLVGFLSQHTAYVLVTFVNEIVIYLIYTSYHQLKGKDHPLTQSNCLSLSLEWILLSIAFLVPVTFTWFPLQTGNYGLNGAVCEIKSLGENCETVGFWDQVIVAVFSYLGSTTVIVLTVVFVAMYCGMTYRYHHVQSSQTKKLLHQTLLLSGLVTIAFLVPVLLSLMYIAVSLTVKQEVYALSLLNAVATPLSMLLIPASFLAFIYTTKSKKIENNHSECFQCCLKLLGKHTQSATTESATTCDTSPHPPTELSIASGSTMEAGLHITESNAWQEDSEDQPLVANTRL